MPVLVERRHFSRTPASSSAAIVLDAAGELDLCVIGDISATGARLLVGDVERIPPHFDLWIPAEGNRVVHTHVIWRRAHALGVNFLFWKIQGPFG